MAAIAAVPPGRPDRDRDGSEERRIDDVVAEAETSAPTPSTPTTPIAKPSATAAMTPRDVRAEIGDGRLLSGFERLHRAQLACDEPV